MDDTEDVSLDFGNEEELAFRKAKIRCVRPGRRQAPSVLQIYSFPFIHSGCTQYLVCAVGSRHTQDRSDKALPSWSLWSWGEGD